MKVNNRSWITIVVGLLILELFGSTSADFQFPPGLKPVETALAELYVARSLAEKYLNALETGELAVKNGKEDLCKELKDIVRRCNRRISKIEKELKGSTELSVEIYSISGSIRRRAPLACK